MVRNSDLFDLYAMLRRSIALEANEVLKEIGLGSRQFLILWSLNSTRRPSGRSETSRSETKRMTVGELVVAAMTDAATISRSLVQLIQNGYVEKIPCQKDGRVHYVQLTAKGQALAPEMERLYRQLAARCFSVLSAQERDQLAALLSKVVDGFQPEREQRTRQEVV